MFQKSRLLTIFRINNKKIQILFACLGAWKKTFLQVYADFGISLLSSKMSDDSHTSIGSLSDMKSLLYSDYPAEVGRNMKETDFVFQLSSQLKCHWDIEIGCWQSSAKCIRMILQHGGISVSFWQFIDIICRIWGPWFFSNAIGPVVFHPNSLIFNNILVHLFLLLDSRLKKVRSLGINFKMKFSSSQKNWQLQLFFLSSIFNTILVLKIQSEHKLFNSMKLRARINYFLVAPWTGNWKVIWEWPQGILHRLSNK